MEVQSKLIQPWPTIEDELRYAEKTYIHMLKVINKALYAYDRSECTTKHLNNIFSAIELAKVIIPKSTLFDAFPKKIYRLGDDPQQKISELVPKVKEELQKLLGLQEIVIYNR